LKIAEDHEIWVRGHTLFQGYYEKGKGTSLPLNDQGWFQTKDLGMFTEGRFDIIGRKDNLFISGGENIQPEEIENAIRTYCSIEEAIVVPLPDVEFGARPGVFLSDSSLLPLIQSKLKDVLPKFKIPDNLGLKPNRKNLKAE
jgi:O-succinylbenzoic acid--CoA ligase